MASHDENKQSLSFLKKVGAEFIGTFVLIFCAAAGPIVNQKYDGAVTLIGNAACAGLAAMVIIFSTGHISGAHLNPAVTVSLAVVRQFPWSNVLPYATAQLVASICAGFALKGIYDPFFSGGVTVPGHDVRLYQAVMLEVVTSFILLYVITAFVADSGPNFVTKQFAGIAIGAAVMLDILIAGPGTGASMNPGRTLGPAVAAGNFRKIWLYFVGPLVGGIAGAVGNTLVSKLKSVDFYRKTYTDLTETSLCGAGNISFIAALSMTLFLFEMELNGCVTTRTTEYAAEFNSIPNINSSSFGTKDFLPIEEFILDHYH